MDSDGGSDRDSHTCGVEDLVVMKKTPDAAAGVRHPGSFSLASRRVPHLSRALVKKGRMGRDDNCT
jgi:hypothetical protein